MISDERDWKGKILKILEELENGKEKRNFFFLFILCNGFKWEVLQERENERLVWREEKFREKRKIIISLIILMNLKNLIHTQISI